MKIKVVKDQISTDELKEIGQEFYNYMIKEYIKKGNKCKYSLVNIIENLTEEIIPLEIIKIAEEREQARKNKDYKKSDELREKINSLGYEIKDK